MHVREMLAAHSQAPEVGQPILMILTKCIETCFDCAQTCTSCVDASTAEGPAHNLAQSIRTCSDCADICIATARTASRQTGDNIDVLRNLLQACVTACGMCAAECEKHAAHHEHHRICGEVCRACEAACRELIAVLP